MSRHTEYRADNLESVRLKDRLRKRKSRGSSLTTEEPYVLPLRAYPKGYVPYGKVVYIHNTNEYTQRILHRFPVSMPWEQAASILIDHDECYCKWMDEEHLIGKYVNTKSLLWFCGY